MMPDFVNVKHVVAKRFHICCECKVVIAPLDVYENQSGRWDGSFSRYKTCSFCESARDFLLNSTEWPGCGEDAGDFWFEHLRDHLRAQAKEESSGAVAFRCLRHVVGMDKRQVVKQRMLEDLLAQHHPVANLGAGYRHHIELFLNKWGRS